MYPSSYIWERPGDPEGRGVSGVMSSRATKKVLKHEWVTSREHSDPVWGIMPYSQECKLCGDKRMIALIIRGGGPVHSRPEALGSAYSHSFSRPRKTYNPNCTHPKRALHKKSQALFLMVLVLGEEKGHVWNKQQNPECRRCGVLCAYGAKAEFYEGMNGGRVYPDDPGCIEEQAVRSVLES